MGQFQLLIQEPPMLVLPSLAVAIGLNEAVMLQQIHYWISQNNHEKKLQQENKTWVTKPLKQLQQAFPFWSLSTIRRTLESLKEQHMIFIEHLNQSPFDRRQWVTVNYGVLMGTDEHIDLSKMNTSQVFKMNNSDLFKMNTSYKDLERVNKNTQTSSGDKAVPPQIKVVREVMRRYPNKATWKQIIAALSPDVTAEQLAPYYSEWVCRGYNPQSLQWLLDWYVSGMIPPAIPNKKKDKNNWVDYRDVLALMKEDEK